MDQCKYIILKVMLIFILKINNLYLLIKFCNNCYNLHLNLIMHLSQNELATKKEKASKS